MTDLPEGERSIEPDPAILARNYVDAETSVRPRFKVYDYAEPRIDIHNLAIETLGRLGILTTDALVVDTGTADAELGRRLYVDYGQALHFRGIDPNIGQFPDAGRYALTPEEWYEVAAKAKDSPRHAEKIIALQATGQTKLWTPAEFLQLEPGTAQDITELLSDNSTDALFALFVLYHLSTGDRDKALRSFSRVLKPGGVAAIATSGRQNKSVQRAFELAIALDLSEGGQHTYSPPPYMNAGFTSERAEQELLAYFPYVYVFHQRAALHITNQEILDAVAGSLRSLRNQFVPEPDETAFEEAMARQVIDTVYKSWLQGMPFTDIIHRSLALCSKQPLELDPAATGFIQLKASPHSPA